MIQKFRKKPLEVEAIQFTGKNQNEIIDFVGMRVSNMPMSMVLNPTMIIKTMEGDMKLITGAWVIKGVRGEFYPCKPDIFELTYEKVFQVADCDICGRSMVPGYACVHCAKAAGEAGG